MHWDPSADTEHPLALLSDWWHQRRIVLPGWSTLSNSQPDSQPVSQSDSQPNSNAGAHSPTISDALSDTFANGLH